MRRSVAAAALCAGTGLCATALAQPSAPENSAGSQARDFTPASPATTGQSQASREENEPPKTPTLNLDLGLSSVYVFRGINMFQKSSQWDQHAFAAPSVTFNVPGTNGLTIGYWGAYQLLGSNIGDKVDAGTGAENDLTVSYVRELAAKLTGGAGVTGYTYPLANKDAAGTRVPVYLEPFVVAAFASFVDVGAKISYMHGVQQAVSAYRYVYLNPSVSKTVTLSTAVSLVGSASFGYKLFTDRSTAVSDANTVDLLASIALPVTLSPKLYVKPSASWAWTDLPGISTQKEMVAFGGVNVGANF